MLGLSTYETLQPLELVPATSRRSPIAALLLSMLFPGLGHLYIGLRRHAAWLIGSQAIAIAVVMYGSGNPHAEAIFVVLTLYCFAMTDAYFAAREWNAGATFLLTGANPRIAAMLNLLTKGFGYFYLGDRTKGIVCFFVVTAVQVVLLLRTNVWTSILAITIQIAIAADAYRVARQRLLADHPDLDHTQQRGQGAIEEANPSGLRPFPASVFFLVVSMIVVLGYAALRALNGTVITTTGTLERGPSGLLYRNAAEHIEVTAPDDWEYSRPPNTLAQLRSDEGSSIIVMEEYSLAAEKSFVDVNEADILKRHPDASFNSLPSDLPVRAAKGFQAAFNNQDGILIHQRILISRRGFKIVLLIETWVNQNQRDVLDGIDKSVRA